MKIKLKPKAPVIASRFVGLDPQNEIFPMLIGCEFLFDIPASEAAAISKVPDSVILHLIKQGKLVGDLNHWTVSPEVLKRVAERATKRGLNAPKPTLALVGAFREHLGAILCERTPALEARTSAFFRQLTSKYSSEHILASISAFFASEKQKENPCYKLDQFQKFLNKTVIRVGTSKQRRVAKSSTKVSSALSAQ